MAAQGFDRIVNGYGEPVQQGLTTDPADYAHAMFNRLVLGVVLAVSPADHSTNRSAYQRMDRRGYLHTCTVQIIEGGGSAHFVLDNVIITPDARAGLDDYSEHLPRGSSGLVTGEAWNSTANNTNPYDLDGDWCIVGFLGGNLDSPFIVRWWPHPRGCDAATSGKTNPNDASATPYLDQAGRFLSRINGVELVVTKLGDVYLSTALANSELSFGTPLTPVNGRFPRITDADLGGSFKAWIKSTQSFTLDWNAPVNGLGVNDAPDPALPQDNPGRTGSPVAREFTHISFSKDTISFEVPEVLELSSSNIIALSSSGTTSVVSGADILVDAGDAFQVTAVGQASLASGGDLLLAGESVVELTGVLDVTVSSDAKATVQGATVDLLSDDAMSLAAVGFLDITGRNISLASTDEGAVETSSVLIASDGVYLGGTGALGGVVGGTPFLQAFSAFKQAVTLAQASAGPASVYAGLITSAVTALELALQSSVSQTIRTD